MIVLTIISTIGVFFYTFFLGLFDLIKALFDLFLANLAFLVLLIIRIVLLLLIAYLWYENQGKILTAVDTTIHCTGKNYYDTEWRPLLEVLREFYDRVVCWTNALRHFGTLFTGKFLAVDVAECALQVGQTEIKGGFYDSLKGFLESVSTILKAVHSYFQNGFGTETLSFYVIIVEFQAILSPLNKLLVCVCETIYILYDLVTRILGIKYISCTVHQYGNGLLSLVQIFANYSIDFVTQLFDWFFTGGSFQAFINLIFREIATLSLPDLTVVFERFLAGSLNIGYFLDDVILVFACTLASEIDFPSDYTASHLAYDICYGNKTYYIPLFQTYTSIFPLLIFPSWQPSSLTLMGLFTSFLPMSSAGYRLLNLGYTFLINLDKVFDPNQHYLRDQWKWEWIIDSLYDPPQRYNRMSTIWTNKLSPTTLSEYNQFGIYGFNTTGYDTQLMENTALLYGYYNLTLPTCNITYHSFKPNQTFVPCDECQIVANVSFEYRMCKLGHQIDYLLFNLTGSTPLSNGQQRRLFQTLLCGLIPKLFRVVGAIVNWPMNFIRNWNELGTFLRQDQWWHAIFDEFGGQENVLGGFLKAVQDLFVFTFDPKLEMVINIFVLPAKSLSEAGRTFTLLFPRTVGTILGPGPQPTTFNTSTPVTTGPLSGLDQTLTTYLCADTSSPTCAKVETIFQWLRVPRQYPVSLSNYTMEFNVTTAYRPLLPINSSFVIVNNTFVDNVANVVNLKFISLFVGYDVLEGFDLSCGLIYLLRAASETGKFIITFIIIALETLNNYINQTSTDSNMFLLLEWIVCARNDLTFNYNIGQSPPSNFYCSNVVDLLSDLEDFLKCPCVFFLDIEVISGSTNNSGGITLNCLCNFTTALVSVIMALIRAALSFIYGIIKIASCLIKNSPAPFTDQDCEDELSNRFIESFNFLDLTFDYLVDLFGSLGCILGNIFGITSGGKCIGGLLTCDSPQPPECTSSYYLALAFTDLAGIVANILQIPIDLVINLLQTTLLGNTLTGFPTSFVQFLSDIVLNVAVGLWGDQTASPAPSDGFLQHLGFFLTCTFGPANCDLTGPASCTGYLLIQIGNNLRQYFTLIYCTVFNLLFFIETLIFGTRSTYCITEGIAAGGQCAQSHLEQAIKCFFQLLFTLLFGGNSGTSIFDFFFIILKAIVGLIPGIGSALVSIIDVVQKIFDFILNVVGTAFLAILCAVTFGQICPSKKRGETTFDPKNFSFFKRFDRDGSGNSPPYDSSAEWWETYYKSTQEYHEMLKEYLNINKEKHKTPKYQKDHETGTQSLFKKFAKRFTSDSLQTSLFSSESTPVLFNQSEFNTVTNLHILLSSMDQTSFCFRALNASIPRIEAKMVEYNNSGYNPQYVIEESGMSLSEELLFRMCYTLAVTPYIYNAASRGRTVQDQVNSATNLDSIFQQSGIKRQTSSPTLEYAWGSIPYDALYSPLSGLNLMKNLVGAFGYYIKWQKETHTYSSFTASPQSMIMDLDPVTDISSPIDLSPTGQNETLSALFISSKTFLTDTIPSLTTTSKRSLAQASSNSDVLNNYLANRIVVGMSFDQYIQSKGINCPYTTSIFQGLDNFMGRQASLNVLAVKSTSILMTMQYEYTRQLEDTTLLSNPQFGGPGLPISDAVLLINNSSKRNILLEKQPMKLKTLAKIITKVVKSGQTYGNTGILNRRHRNMFSHVISNGINDILIPTKASSRKFETNFTKSVSKLINFKIHDSLWFKSLPDHIKPEPKEASKRLLQQFLHLPIFKLHNQKRNDIIRIPIYQYLKAVVNITYNTLILQYHKTKIDMERSTTNFNLNNPWSKFSRPYILDRLRNTSTLTNVEKIYYQSEQYSSKIFGKSFFKGTRAESLMKDLERRPFLNQKRQSGFGFNTSCFILDDFIERVSLFLNFNQNTSPWD